MKEDVLKNKDIKIMVTWDDEAQKFCADLLYKDRGNIQGYGETVDEALNNVRDACKKDFG